MVPQDRVHTGAGRVSGKEATVLVIVGVAGERAKEERQVRRRGPRWTEVVRKRDREGQGLYPLASVEERAFSWLVLSKGESGMSSPSLGVPKQGLESCTGEPVLPEE